MDVKYASPSIDVAPGIVLIHLHCPFFLLALLRSQQLPTYFIEAVQRQFILQQQQILK